jgi:hypothetical protein
MALSILDGNQSATTLSTILSSGQHITAHTVVSLGTQAITDMRGAVSGSVVSISNFPSTQPVSIASVTIGNTVTIAGTVTANPTGTQTIAGTVTVGNTVTVSGTVNAGLASENDFVVIGEEIAQGINNQGTIPISGTVTANLQDGALNVAGIAGDQGGARPNYGVQLGYLDAVADEFQLVADNKPLPISGTITIGSALPAGTNRIGVVTIGAGTVTLGASTSQIGSVTASISNSVVTFYPLQGTAVSNTNFTSTTASTTLVSAVAGREVLTVFNEGAGNLFISPGATATTISYQIRLSPGDYWECPAGQLSLAHTAVFATAGTARVTEVS